MCVCVYCLPWLLPLAAMPSAIYVYGGFLAHYHRLLSTSKEFLVDVHGAVIHLSMIFEEFSGELCFSFVSI